MEDKYKESDDSVEINGSKFAISKDYSIYELVGKGAYGLVVSAADKNNDKKIVAIKKIEKVFEHAICAKRTLREVKISRLLKHDNILSLITIIQPKSKEEFNDVYCISELMETDLSSIIKSEQEITDEHIQFFLYQILRGVLYIHSAGIIHRDLKPKNLLVNENCDLKICDFGLTSYGFQLQ